MIDLFEELGAISAALETAGVPAALVGGLAVCVWTEPRNTIDIDLLIAPEDWARVPAILEPLGYHQLSMPMDFGHIRIRRLTKFVGSFVLPLDFLLADGEFMGGLRRRVAISEGDRAFYVAPPDAIIALKQGRMSDKDKLDIQALSKLLGDAER